MNPPLLIALTQSESIGPWIYIQSFSYIMYIYIFLYEYYLQIHIVSVFLVLVSSKHAVLPSVVIQQEPIRFLSGFPHQPAMHSGRSSHGGSGELCATQWKPTKHTDGATNCFLTGRREKVVYYGHMDRIIKKIALSVLGCFRQKLVKFRLDFLIYLILKYVFCFCTMSAMSERTSIFFYLMHTDAVQLLCSSRTWTKGKQKAWRWEGIALAKPAKSIPKPNKVGKLLYMLDIIYYVCVCRCVSKTFSLALNHQKVIGRMCSSFV